ncbi:uncharacterized protein LOC100824277 [Brachypodium distachyon]|uniref:DUF1618 domain-containing protein n=1 Tax=Brachypodium distachyon TaxID=15368 RepID=A0A0Q3ISY9_BRADI|nr:uncharacterized protein LOC100824277 [Brachypodium distachyon]KQK03532.2 hypothetical protein BRADI_2g08430v3 [Brachypodium distachyon]|eukprot:XP_003565562.2 uncharacterized protein LOC100824277 [Brachypodium distachyon]
MEEPPPPPPEWPTEQGKQWAILVCVPHVVPGEHDYPPGTEFSLRHDNPPQSSRFTVPSRIASDPKDIENHPYVAAVGAYGRFLLYATQGNCQALANPHILDWFHTEPLGVHHGSPKAYFICDLKTGAATRLPNPDPEHPILNPGNVGLINSSFGSVVVELQPPTAGNHRATLLCYVSRTKYTRLVDDTDTWLVKDVHYPPVHRPWGAHGVIFDQPRLTWVDLSYGLLTSYMFLYGNPNLQLRFIPLPAGCERPSGTVDLDKERCVGMSAGSLRYVQIDLLDGDPTVRKWTLVNWATGSWRHDSNVSFKVIWADASYKAMKLPRVVPTVAFIDPRRDHVVYFFLQSRIFGVDVRTGEFIHWIFFKMNSPPSRYHSSRFVRLWEQTKELFDGAGSDDQEDFYFLRCQEGYWFP